MLQYAQALSHKLKTYHVKIDSERSSVLVLIPVHILEL